jgi:hypothetical protein
MSSTYWEIILSRQAKAKQLRETQCVLHQGQRVSGARTLHEAGTKPLKCQRTLTELHSVMPKKKELFSHCCEKPQNQKT